MHMNADKTTTINSTTAASPGKAKDPKLHGFAVAWRLALVVAACAIMFTWRLDFISSSFFMAAILVALFRFPRMFRLARAGDFISASPWLFLAIGTMAALYYQSWAKDEAVARFNTVVAAIERDPCRADQLLPPVVRQAGGEGGTWHVFPVALLDYAVLARRDAKLGTLTIVLHLDLDSAYAREVKLPSCH
jgi:hypothetical protein